MSAARDPFEYLQGYPPELVTRARQLIEAGELGARLTARYPDAHDVRTDEALTSYVLALKQEFLRTSDPVHRVLYDNKLHVVRQALGTHSRIPRVQGGRITTRREIRVAAVFREAPADFLRMIAVHELAHLREAEHDKAFYRLCLHMEPRYHELEFDLRLYLADRAFRARAR